MGGRIPVHALLDDPAALRHHEQVAAAVRDVTAGDRPGDCIAAIDLIAPDHSREARHLAQRELDRPHSGRRHSPAVEQPLGEVDLTAEAGGDVGALGGRTPGLDQRLLDHGAEVLVGDPAGPVLLGNDGHPVIRSQRQQIAVASNRAVQVLDQRADRRVEVDEDVFDFAAAGPEVVPDHVERGEADTQEVGRAPLPELPLIDQPGGETAQICVRQRTLLPVIGEHRVNTRAPGDAMRKQGRPAAIGPLARERVAVLIGVRGRRQLPLAVLFGLEAVVGEEPGHVRHRCRRESRRGDE